LGETGSVMKRFYKEVSVSSDANGFGILLDGRGIKTPAKAPLLLPARALADAVAGEWAIQGETIEPKSMPLTRHANSVIDRIIPQRAAVIDEISKFGGSDVICYGATDPADLAALQLETWTPLRDWARAALGANLKATAGVSPITQSDVAMEALKAAVTSHDDWQLSALHEAVSITGSLVIGLALSHGRVTAPEAWSAGQLDELFQVARWGEDSLAAAARAAKQRALDVAAHLFHLLQRP
jgi:chaperone required for assembly of F1-ATPase